MIDNPEAWFWNHWVEITGTLLGTAYVFLSVKQNIFTWLTGFLTSVLYTIVFFQSKFYADMGLQVYYIWISLYGWFIWTKGNTSRAGRSNFPVSQINKRLMIVLTLIALLLWLIIYFVLKQFTDSPVPFGDAFTTAFSIVATWMLARKILEHWLIWIVVDLISMGLYLWKGLYPTAILFLIYTVVAFWGYSEWKKGLTHA
jgi:nicotinamide mononucleotide transporter